MTIRPTHWIHEAPRTIALTRSADLERTPDVVFELGRAADGLPLALHVRREVNVRGPVVAALRSPERLTPELEKALTALERATHSHTITRGIVSADRHLYYETAGAVPSLFGQTVLARMLGATSPMVLPEDIARTGSSAPARFESTALINLQDLKEVAEGEPPLELTVAAREPMWVLRDSR